MMSTFMKVKQSVDWSQCHSTPTKFRGLISELGNEPVKIPQDLHTVVTTMGGRSIADDQLSSSETSYNTTPGGNVVTPCILPNSKNSLHSNSKICHIPRKIPLNTI